MKRKKKKQKAKEAKEVNRAKEEKAPAPDDESRDTEVEEMEEPMAKARGRKAEDEDEQFNGKDRRKHQRVKVKLHMIYEDGKTGIKTNVVNISLGGAFLEMPRPPQKGAEISLTPILPDKGPEKSEVHLKGRVVRVVEYNLPDVGPKTGVGIEFTDIQGGENNVLADIFRKSVDEARSEAEKEEEEVEEGDDSSKTGEWNPLDEEDLKKK